MPAESKEHYTMVMESAPWHNKIAEVLALRRQRGSACVRRWDTVTYHIPVSDDLTKMQTDLCSDRTLAHSAKQAGSFC
jgi:hypothetical protein